MASWKPRKLNFRIYIEHGYTAVAKTSLVTLKDGTKTNNQGTNNQGILAPTLCSFDNTSN